MLKHSLIAIAGLAAVAPAASADALLPLLPRPDLSAEIAPLNAPAFDRMVELCDRFGIACSVPGVEDYAEADPEDIFDLIPLAQADAAKRWALYAEEWAEIAELYEEYAPSHVPAPDFPDLADGYGYSYGWHHGGSLGDVAEMLEDVQERLDRRIAPVHVLPRTRLGWQHPFTTLPGHYSYGFAGPRVIRPYTAPHLPGNSVILLPAR